MKFKQFEAPKWRKRRNQSSGSLILALNHMRNKFQNASARVAESRRELHTSKANLRSIIAEYKKLEREVKQKKAHFKHSMQQLEAKIKESESTCVLSEGEQLTAWYYSQNIIRNAQSEIEETDIELVETALIDSNEYNPNNESLTAVTPMSCRVMITDIDSSGTIQQNGFVKFDNAKKCSVCLEKDINSIFYLCKHECCCFDCATKIIKNNEKCPVCNCSSKKIIKTYTV